MVVTFDALSRPECLPAIHILQNKKIDILKNSNYNAHLNPLKLDLSWVQIVWY